MIAAATLGAVAGLAALMAASGPPADEGFTWPGAAELESRELASLDRAQRLRAVERLAGREGAEAARLLSSLLQDSEPGVRVTAARALARRGNAAGLDAAARWVSSATPADRTLGLEVLREAATLPSGARRAVERSLADSDAGLRLLAIEALARHELAPSFAAIAAALDDEQREIRLRAIRMLERARDPRGPLVLLGRLGDADRAVRLEAIHALGALGDARVVPALTRELQEGSEDVRLAAVGALGRLKAAGAVPALATLARRRPLDDLARQAQLALGEIATPPAVAILLERLRESPQSEQVKDSLRRAGPAAVPSLIEELKVGTASSRNAAALLLGEIGERRATTPLMEAVERQGSASAAAIGALARLRDPAAVAVLARATSYPTPELRRLAWDALAAIGDPRAAGIVGRGVDDPDSAVRCAALRLAARIGAKDVAPAIVARVGDRDEAVRREAIAALIALDVHPQGTVAALLAALRLPTAASPASAAAERAALGDALEAAAGERDGVLLVAALREGAATGPARSVIARGLLAAHARRRLGDEAAVEALLQMVGEGGTAALAAADALALTTLSDERSQALLALFVEAEPGVRARLCPALAASGARPALARLAVALEDQDEADEVRAAAAWALGAGARPAALDRLGPPGRTSHPAVAANARAALAAAANADRPALASSWVGLRALSPAGDPLPRHWLMARAAGGPWVWVRTGDDGIARLWGLGPGPIELSATEPARVSVRRWSAPE